MSALGPGNLFMIRYTGAVPSIAKRRLNQIQKQAFAMTGEHWHKAMLPHHFTHKGARRYGYQPRDGERGSRGARYFRTSYTGRKLRKRGHTYPLVLTGESRALSRIRDVRATSKGVRIVIHARKLNFRRTPSAPNMREEVTRVTNEERVVLQNKFNGYMAQMLNRINETETKRV